MDEDGDERGGGRAWGNATPWIVAASVVAIVAAIVAWRARRRTESETPLAELAKRMKTGDLLLFSNRGREAGTDPIGGQLTAAATYIWRALEDCEFSHVGMVWRHPRTGELFCLESYAYQGDEGVPDQLTMTIHSGPQIVRLEERLRSYNGYAAWRPLGRALDAQRALELLVSAMDEDLRFHSNLAARFLDRMVGLEGRLDGVQGNHKEGTGMSCTELLGRLYTAMGAVRRERVPPLHAWTPRDFSDPEGDRWAPAYRPRVAETTVVTVAGASSSKKI